MQVELAHHFAAPVSAVLGSLTSQTYAAQLAREHSFFSHIQLLSCKWRDGVLERVVRYRGRPFIARVGPFSLPADWFEWMEYARYESETGVLRFSNEFVHERLRGRIRSGGQMRFCARVRDDGSELTTRQTQFEFQLGFDMRYRPLAGFVLSMISRQLVSSLDEEAKLLVGWLESGAAAIEQPVSLSA